ncbi:MAG: lysoplasmalogenase [Flavobacteriaceae bacterium]
MMAPKSLYLSLILVIGISAIVLQELGMTLFYGIAKSLTTIAIIFFASGNRSMSRLSAQMVTALIFCLLGDIALIWDHLFLLGVAFFLIAHLLFIRALSSRFGFRLAPVALIFALALILGMSFYLWSGLDNTLKIAIPIYATVIGLMGAQAISIGLRRRSSIRTQIALGGTLFILSDALLGINAFKEPFDFSGVFILSTYWAALTLLANAGREF